jgi:hypothetical protein
MKHSFPFASKVFACLSLSGEKLLSQVEQQMSKQSCISAASACISSATVVKFMSMLREYRILAAVQLIFVFFIVLGSLPTQGGPG